MDIEYIENRFSRRMNYVLLLQGAGERRAARRAKKEAQRQYAEAAMFIGLGVDLPEDTDD